MSCGAFCVRVLCQVCQPRSRLVIWPTTIHCIDSAELSNLYSTQSLHPTPGSQPLFPARAQMMTSKLAHPGVRRRARWQTCSKRYVHCYLRLSRSTSLGDQLEFCDEVARRDELGVERCLTRHRQPPFAIYAACYPTPPGRVPRLRKRIQTDKGTRSSPVPILKSHFLFLWRAREMFRRPSIRLTCLAVCATTLSQSCPVSPSCQG